MNTFNRRTFSLAAVLAVAVLTGCDSKWAVTNIIGNTPGERETKIQNQMSALRSQSPYQLGQRAGGKDARDMAGIGGANPDEDDESIKAEALRRLGEELPLFNGQYEDGFRAGWQEALEISDLGFRSRATIGAGRRDFEEGTVFDPRRYGLSGWDTENYSNAWDRAEEEATPVSSSIFDKDRDSRGDM